MTLAKSREETNNVLFVGIDWAEAHHDICVMDPDGHVLRNARVPDGMQGVARIHELVAEHAQAPGGAPDPTEVVVGIELDRGLLVSALTASSYQVYAINPLAASRYRERHTTSRAKSDRGDAKVLADLVRTDRHVHRQVAGDSEQAQAIRVLARAHQSLVWTRQRQTNALRSALREFSPGAPGAFGTELAGRDALAVLALAPTPALGRAPSRAQLARCLQAASATSPLERPRSTPPCTPPNSRPRHWSPRPTGRS